MRKIVFLILLVLISIPRIFAEEPDSPPILFQFGLNGGYRYQAEQNSIDPVPAHWFYGADIGLVFRRSTDLALFLPGLQYRFGMGLSLMSVRPDGFRAGFNFPNIYIGNPQEVAASASLVGGFGFNTSGNIDDIHFGAGAGIAFRSIDIRYAALVDLRGSISHRLSAGYLLPLR
jgi:hypothetical protein